MTTLTLFVDELDGTNFLDELAYCLEAGFPAEVTAALLLLANDHELLAQTLVVWDEWVGPDNDDFIRAVSEVTDGGECWFCDDCGTVVWSDETSTIANGDRVCDNSCRDNYYWCFRCQELYDETTTVEGDNEVCNDCLNRWYTQCYQCDNWGTDTSEFGNRSYCESCFDNNFSYCDDCNEWYDDDEGHEHENGCGCEAPHWRFDFPANGHGSIEQNQRLIVELPKGTIDDEGIARICKLLYNTMDHEIVDVIVEDVGPLWQAKRGNFTRRLSSALYSQHKIKLAPSAISEVGNIARAHSSDSATWHIELTRDLNSSAGAFCNDESCWWGGYAGSRCCLKSWGGIGLRTYPDLFRDVNCPEGRAWVQPLDCRLGPTHDALNAHAYVVYNAYGNLSGYIAARIVAHLTSRSYCKIELVSDNTNPYINNNAGYLVADEATCEATERLRFNYDEHDQHDAHAIDMKAAA